MNETTKIGTTGDKPDYKQSKNMGHTALALTSSHVYRTHKTDIVMFFSRDRNMYTGSMKMAMYTCGLRARHWGCDRPTDTHA